MLPVWRLRCCTRGLALRMAHSDRRYLCMSYEQHQWHRPPRSERRRVLRDPAVDIEGGDSENDLGLLACAGRGAVEPPSLVLCALFAGKGEKLTSICALSQPALRSAERRVSLALCELVAQRTNRVTLTPPRPHTPPSPRQPHSRAPHRSCSHLRAPYQPGLRAAGWTACRTSCRRTTPPPCPLVRRRAVCRACPVVVFCSTSRSAPGWTRVTCTRKDRLCALVHRLLRSPRARAARALSRPRIHRYQSCHCTAVATPAPRLSSSPVSSDSCLLRRKGVAASSLPFSGSAYSAGPSSTPPALTLSEP